MRNIVIYSLATAIVSSGSVCTAASAWSKSSRSPSFLLAMPRGGASSSGESYEAKLESAKSRAIEKAYVKIEEARRKIVDERTAVPDFGAKADEICSAAIEEFAKSVPPPADQDEEGTTSSEGSSSSSSSSSYARKLRELEIAIDAPLQVLYLRQLALHRDAALSAYRAASRTADGSDYEGMLAADARFVRDAESSTRRSSADWTYDAERSALQSVMNDAASVSRRLVDVQVKSSSQQSTAMQFLQQQQQMIQQLQQQLYGQSSPWNVGIAYRVPDTNFNLQGSYQSGRANLQLSCVPDEYAPMLGPNGFTNGVGPGNLGLSLSLSI